MKKLSYVAIAFGVVLLLGQEYLSGILMLGSGLLILNNRKLKKQPGKAPITENLLSRLNPVSTTAPQTAVKAPTPQAPGKAPTLQTKTQFTFNVAGIEYEGRSKLIEEYLSRYAEPYDGMTNKEMKEYDGDTFYKYEKIIDSNAVEFVMEPNNKFDPNAIAVHHNELGKIGYVPAARTATLRKFLDKSKEYTTEIEFYGGPYKRVYDEEIQTGKTNYSANVKIVTPLKG